VSRASRLAGRVAGWLRSRLAALAALAALAGTVPAAAQPGEEPPVGGPEQAAIEQRALTAALRGDYPLALQYQREAVAHIDAVGPNYLVYRSHIRFRLGSLMILAGDCAASIPVFREAGRLVTESSPAIKTEDSLSNWYEQDLRASEGVIRAYLCDSKIYEARQEVVSVRRRFGSVSVGGGCVKAQIEGLGMAIERDLGNEEGAKAAYREAQSHLSQCDQPYRDRIAALIEQSNRR
jgi:hypothetical protein